MSCRVAPQGPNYQELDVTFNTFFFLDRYILYLLKSNKSKHVPASMLIQKATHDKVTINIEGT